MLSFRIIILVFLIAPAAHAEVATTRPYKPLTYQHETRDNPAQDIYAMSIDLTDPAVQIRVVRAGPDPDGNGPMHTTLMPPTQIAQREGFDLVINGDFFSQPVGHDAEGVAAQRQFKVGNLARVIGPAVTDGQIWCVSDKEPRPAFEIDDTNRASIHKMQQPTANARQVVAGSTILVRDGENVAPDPSKSSFSKGPHPRTSVGLTKDGKTLLLIVVDGRQPGRAVGMSLRELADLMIQHGAKDAMNLDGGGSSVMALRNPQTHKLEILNHPSDRRERPVANVLGVRFSPPPATQEAH